MNELKLLTRRAYGVLILTLLLILGLLFFVFRYVKDASVWAEHSFNKHLYTNGQLKSAGTIYDRNGAILLQTVDGNLQYNENSTVRKAMMHAVGDAKGNVVTSAQVAFREKLTGWDMLNGAFQWENPLNRTKNDLILTLDSELCTVAYNAMNGRKGTVGVYNYETGEILCMVSLPTFDPKNPPDVEANPDKYEGVYINRLFSAAYTPGSVFKLVTAAAALDQFTSIDKRVYQCEGEATINGQIVTCPKPHGNVTLEQALAKSCNVAFAEISLELGGDTLQKYADKAGFNTRLKVDSIKTAMGKVSVSDAEGGDLAWAGIGQYSDTANPLNFMAYVGSIANDGVRVTPRILKGKGLLSNVSDAGAEKKRILAEETARQLGAMMRNNVINEYGDKNYKGLELCAKSGTAEVGGDQQPHAWFAGFLDREDCPLAFVVVVENGGSGSKVAGAVAAKVLKAAVKSMTEQ